MDVCWRILSDEPDLDDGDSVNHRHRAVGDHRYVVDLSVDDRRAVEVERVEVVRNGYGADVQTANGVRVDCRVNVTGDPHGHRGRGVGRWSSVIAEGNRNVDACSAGAGAAESQWSVGELRRTTLSCILIAANR